MNNSSNNSSMKMRVPGAKQAIDKMKYEIANEFGVNLGTRCYFSCQRISWW